MHIAVDDVLVAHRNLVEAGVDGGDQVSWSGGERRQTNVIVSHGQPERRKIELIFHDLRRSHIQVAAKRPVR